MGKAHIKKGNIQNSKGKSVESFMQLGQMDPCGCFGWGDCPCCHFFLKDICTGEKTYFWAKDGNLESGFEEDFKIACSDCKEEITETCEKECDK